MTDVVYALHTFEAENEDELTFEAGERIIVLERDDQYSDGWFQGRNERGEIGLFPQSYTSSRPPSPDPASPRDDAIAEEPANTYETAQSTPVATAGAFTRVVAVEPAAAAAPVSTSPPVIDRRNSLDETSLHSHLTEDGDEDEAAPSQTQRLSDGAAHRAALAARVSQNAERAAEEARELAERRKREDEERYIQSANQAGLIDGLQLSDESDEDEGEEPVESFLPLPAPLPAPIGVDQATPAPAPADLTASEAAEARPDLRPRADTETSTYDESDASLYANQSSFADLSQSQNSAPVPVDEVPMAQAIDSEPFEPPKTTSNVASSVEASPRSGEMTPTHPVARTAPASPTAAIADDHAGTILAATGAGLAGVSAAGVATAFGSHADFASRTDSQTEGSSPPPQHPRSANGTAVEMSSAVTAASSAALASTPAAGVSPALPHAPRMSSPLAVDSTHAAVAPSVPPLGTPVSAPHSSFSPSSTVRSTASPVVAWDALPADPIDWTVDNVVDWGQQKGFDEGILSKFVEHEITGDVLLEMDVAMLKEIDLIAFGRRVRVYNAIKELRHRTQPGNLMSSLSTTGGALSPALTGYGPESPAGLAYSPMTGVYSRSSATSEPARWDPSQEQSKASTEPLAGLGLQDEVLVGDRAMSSQLGNSQGSSVGNAQESGGPTGQAFPAGSPVQTQGGTAAAGTAGNAESLATSRPPKNQSRLSSAASSLRPRSPRRGRPSDGNDDATLQSETTAAVPAEDHRDSKGEKPVFSMPGLPVVGRNRKPPPRVPSALLIDSDGAVARPRQRTTLQDRARRSTRLFSSFGGSSGDKSPTAVQSIRSRTSNSTLAVGRDAPTAMSVKPVDPVTKAMAREKGIKVTDGNLMDKIGRPDHSGWMRKKGEQYNTWKMRFFVLKGTYLYYLKSEAEQRAKGVIDLTGYRVISDPDIRPGEFAFKITHPNERTHYFAAAEQITIRTWMKEILKATIFRDYAAPVVSSCDIETLSLDAAKSLSPRPPSPTQRAEIQKKRYAGTNPNTLSQKDAAILMELAPGSPYMNGENLSDSVAKRPSVAPGEARKASVTSLDNAQSTQQDIAPPVGMVPTTPAQNAVANSSTSAAAGQSVEKTSTNAELLRWVNANLPAGTTPLPDLSRSLRSGRPVVRLLENLSGKQSGISDKSFDAFNENAGASFDPSYIDTLFSVFDYISPLASTDEISMEDMMTGNTERMQLLLERIRKNFPGSSA